MESRWIYGVHVESIWNLWGSVKYSKLHRKTVCFPLLAVVFFETYVHDTERTEAHTRREPLV